MAIDSFSGPIGDYADKALLTALAARNHEEVATCLNSFHANPNTTLRCAFNPNGSPAIFCVDPSDTKSLVLLLKAGANPDAPNQKQGITLVTQIADNLSEVTPRLRSQLHRIGLLLAAKASTENLEADLADHWGFMKSNSRETEGAQRASYEEAMAEVQKTIDLVHAINEKGDTARPSLADLFPSPVVAGGKTSEGRAKKPVSKTKI